MTTTITAGARGAATALAVALLASACGSGTPGEPSGGDAPEGSTVVRFWQQQFTDEENEWYESVVNAFNDAHDDVWVDYEVVPGDAWDQRMTAAQAAGNAPDVRTLNYGNIFDSARTSQILPLTTRISAEAWDDVQENVLDTVTVEGERYAYPLLVEPSAILYYRTDLFTAAGLDPARPPSTWDELVDYANRLTDDQVFGIRLAQNAVDAAWSTWGYQWDVAGQLPISDDWSTAAADAAYAPLLQAFQDLFRSGALPPPDGPGYPDAAPFGEGKFAMMANGSWAASQLVNDYPEIVDKVAAAPMPSFSGRPDATTATLGGWTLVVDGGSEQPEAAAEFIEWAIGSDPDRVVPFFESTAFSKVSPRTSVSDAIAALPRADTVNPWREVVAEQVVPYARAEPVYPWNISLAMGEAIEAAMQGEPVADALAEANRKIQTEIDNSELAGQGP